MKFIALCILVIVGAVALFHKEVAEFVDEPIIAQTDTESAIMRTFGLIAILAGVMIYVS